MNKIPSLSSLWLSLALLVFSAFLIGCSKGGLDKATEAQNPPGVSQPAPVSE